MPIELPWLFVLLAGALGASARGRPGRVLVAGILGLVL